ncbi:MAG: hypothetical protein EA001_06470 [Oscillatoriales cyanobacterium]|nr:MAG: hypothetical protein EA001_06470 [Oscillatoriales cyanobacterium]
MKPVSQQRPQLIDWHQAGLALRWQQFGSWCLAVMIAGAGSLAAVPAQALLSSQRSGDAGPSVARLQRQLQRLGTYSGPLDGRFGPATAVALTAFQRSRGLYSKPAVDMATRQALLEATERDGTLAANLQLGDRGPSTVELQQILERLGFLAVEPNGQFDNSTRRALEAFQRSMRLSATGNVDSVTMRALRERGGTASGQLPNRPGANGQVGFGSINGSLRPGQRNTAVRNLQTKLRQLNYFRANPTGYYGSITTAAVRSFQRAMGLPATGQADAGTLRALNSRSGSRMSNQIAAGRSRSASANAPNRFDMRYVGRDYQQLRPGDRGDRVKLLQDRLRELGFFSARSTGNYGDITRAAVQNFQQSRRLPATGIATTATQRALFGTPISAANRQRSWVPRSGSLSRSDDRWIMPGDRGERVSVLQKRLADFGLLGFDRVTGRYDTATAQAVMNFQRSRRLSPTGIADLSTQRAMGLLE